MYIFTLQCVIKAQYGPRRCWKVVKTFWPPPRTTPPGLCLVHFFYSISVYFFTGFLRVPKNPSTVSKNPGKSTVNVSKSPKLGGGFSGSASSSGFSSGDLWVAETAR